MSRTMRSAIFVVAAASCVLSSACQSPTDPDETLDVDDFVDATAVPNPTSASESTDGRTYRVVRGNNQPDEILPYDWRTSFAVTVTLNGKADDEGVDLDFPVRLTSATAVAKQASGGILSPPSGGSTEHSEFVIASTTGNTFGGINTSQSMVFDVWYDLPSLRREAIIQVALAFTDNDGTTFTKTLDVMVAP